MTSPEPIKSNVYETWKILNIRRYVNQVHASRSYDNSPEPRPICRPIDPYNFIIGKRSGNEDEDCLRAQASISTSENNLDLILTISLEDRQKNHLSGLNIKFLQIAFYDGSGNHLSTLHQQWRTNSDFEEFNLLTSNCTAHIPFDSKSINPKDNSMTILFYMHCNILKSATTIVPESPITQETDFQLCESLALNDYKALLNDPTTADVKIIATKGEREFFDCHKIILAARSPVFRAMFETTMKETQENIVTVEDISRETMEHFLSFLYCGRFQKDSWVKYLPQLTYAAEKYCVSSLKQVCDTNLIKSVTCENALVIADLAHRYELPNAALDIRKFIEKNARKLSLDIAAATKSLEI